MNCKDPIIRCSTLDSKLYKDKSYYYPQDNEIISPVEFEQDITEEEKREGGKDGRRKSV